jgi:hypothetical protein
MIKSDPLQQNDLAFVGQMFICKTNLPTYSAVLGFT